MNRRRMMMQPKANTKHIELEITEGNTLLCNMEGRDFIKVNNGLAICAIIKSNIYWLPILVSETEAVVTYRTTPDVGIFPSIASVEYEGRTYYVSHYHNAMRQDEKLIENPYNLPILNDVIDKSSYPNTRAGQQQAAKDLLDYYFYKT